MFVIKESFEAFYEVKKSQFLSFLVSIEEFDKVYEKLKKEHSKANHIVWAKRYLNEKDQIVEDFTDDGEPKGTSGTPVLNVLRGEELVNVGILIVRYFGGIKLGTGGIARAYTSAAKEAVKKAKFLPYLKSVKISFKTSYSLIQRIEHFLKNRDISFNDREFYSDKVLWRLCVSEDKIEDLRDFLKRFRIEEI